MRSPHDHSTQDDSEATGMPVPSKKPTSHTSSEFAGRARQATVVVALCGTVAETVLSQAPLPDVFRTIATWLAATFLVFATAAAFEWDKAVSAYIRRYRNH